MRRLIAAADTPPTLIVKCWARLRALEAERDDACAEYREVASEKSEAQKAAAREVTQERARQEQIAETTRRAAAARAEAARVAAEAQAEHDRLAAAKIESDKAAAIAKIAADKVAGQQAWTIPKYDHWVDRRGRDIPDDRHGDYNLVGQTTMYRCLWVINHQGVLG